MNSFEIALKTKQLPTKYDDLIELSYVGDTAVKMNRNIIKSELFKKMPEERQKVILKDGQDIGVMLLDIETEIGRLVPDRGKNTNSHNRKGDSSFSKKTWEEVTKRRDSKRIANHPEEKKQIIKEAIENDDIPTKTAVLNKIKLNKEIKRRKKAEGKNNESKLEMNLNQQNYIIALERCINLLPSAPPKDWGANSFDMAKGLANILIKRLEVFNGKKIKSLS